MTRWGLALVLWAAASTPAEAQGYLVVITGIGGDPHTGRTFHQWASALAAAAPRLGLPDSHVIYLGDDPTLDPGRIAARSTKANVEVALRGVAGRVRAGDQVVVVLIGHGSERQGEPRFNLPGPDITAAEFAALLSTLPTERVAFVNTTSASGGFLPVLSAPGRAVVTATKSGFERNQTRFPQYFVDAVTGDGADTDKDARVSLLEAFIYARREVARAYETEDRLLTEHAMLDDNGDGEGSAEPGREAADGALAGTILLAGAQPAAAATHDPELERLYGKRADLERRLAALRQRKAELAPDEYERQLEELLVELAMTGRAIRAREAKGREP